MFRLLMCCSIAFLSPGALAERDADTSVGAARIDITPDHPVVLAGYGHRTGEHEGVDDRIWARALAIGDDDPLVLIAVDNAGVPAALVVKVAEALAGSGVRREHLVVSSTHTHTAPNLVGFASVMWAERLTPEQKARQHRYTDWAVERMIEVAELALRDREPAQLTWGRGRVAFGGNRRVVEDGTWRGFGFAPESPVDHGLPVLIARDASERPIAIWTSYACHCTTVGGRNRIGGDWAGYATAGIEARFPGAVSLLTIGCGADIGPQPSGSLDIARRHGQAIAEEVARLASGSLTPLDSPPSSRVRRIELPLGEAPGREHWARESERDDFRGVLARRMLARLEGEGTLPSTVDYELSVWRFGDELAIVFLAGEVVVDYALRLSTELDGRRLWINAYSHAMPGYIPSRRVLDEGGYEPEFSMVYYGWPTRFDPRVEDRLVGAVKEPVGPGFTPSGEPISIERFHHPRSFARFPERLKGWLQRDDQSEEVRRGADRVLEWSSISRNGFQRLLRNDGEEDSWYDFAGSRRLRPFIRQLEPGLTLEWETAATAEEQGPDEQVFVFLGGLGWESEPETGGFSLHVEGVEQLRFDLTRSPRSWQSEEGRVRLHYLPTWTSSLDSGGIFHLIVASELLEPGRPCRLAVRSEGSGSKRWFAVDTIPDAKAIEKMVAGAASE